MKIAARILAFNSALAASWLLTACLHDTDGIGISPDGTVSVPALEVPGSALMSPEGNSSRVEHITTERLLKGLSVEEANAALFGPRLERTKAEFLVISRDDTIAGVGVRIFEPVNGIAREMEGRVLLHVHGGGFVGCFNECGGLEAIPIAALARVKVVSIDYRLAPAAKFPEASEDVAAVYQEVLKTTPAEHIGLFGCSAGGLLTAQSLAWFQQQGLPTPAAAGIFCAGGDPSMSGDSRIIGMVLGDGELPAPTSRNGTAPPSLGYMRNASLSDLAAYPARHDETLARFPPTLVIVGTRDFAMSSAVNLHSRLVANGVDARLHVWEGGRHAFFYDVRVPESGEAYDVISDFFTLRLQ